MTAKILKFEDRDSTSIKKCLHCGTTDKQAILFFYPINIIYKGMEVDIEANSGDNICYSCIEKGEKEASNERE